MALYEKKKFPITRVSALSSVICSVWERMQSSGSNSCELFSGISWEQAVKCNFLPKTKTFLYSQWNHFQLILNCTDRFLFLDFPKPSKEHKVNTKMLRDFSNRTDNRKSFTFYPTIEWNFSPFVLSWFVLLFVFITNNIKKPSKFIF